MMMSCITPRFASYILSVLITDDVIHCWACYFGGCEDSCYVLFFDDDVPLRSPRFYPYIQSSPNDDVIHSWVCIVGVMKIHRKLPICPFKLHLHTPKGRMCLLHHDMSCRAR